MENVTNNNAKYLREYEAELWLASFCINIFIMIISLWLAASIAVYGCTTGKFRPNKRTRLSEDLLMRLAFVIAILLFPRITTTHALLWFGFEPGPDSDRTCEQLIDASVFVYNLALFPIGVFLWLRQRSLYLQPSLRSLYTTPLKILSWGSILFLFCSGIGLMFLLMIPTEFEASGNGCRGSDGVDPHKNVLYVLTAVIVVGELSILFLFIYPLYRHRQPQFLSSTSKEDKGFSSRADYSNNDVTLQTSVSVPSPNKPQNSKQCNRKNNARSARMSKTSKRVYRTMRISVMCASTCILSDLLSFTLVTFFLPPDTLRSFRDSLHDINLLINFVSIIFCFESYKKIFTILGATLLRRTLVREKLSASYNFSRNPSP